MSKRLTTAVVASILVFAIAIPAVGTCCVAKPGSRMAAMHASMPCCAQSCKLTSPSTTRDHDFTAVSAPSPDVAVVVAAAIADLSSIDSSMTAPINERASNAFSPPPPFLLNNQFRI